MDRRDFLKTAMAVTATSAVTLTGCGNGGEPVLSSDEITINGVYLDDSWRSKNSDVDRVVVVSYTLTPSKNVQTYADALGINTDGKGHGGLDHLNDTEFLLPNYWLKHMPNFVNGNTNHEYAAGDTINMVAFYRIPQTELENTEIKFSHSDVSGAKKLHMSSDDIVICEDTESLVKQIDPEGYQQTIDALTPLSTEESNELAYALLSWEFSAGETIGSLWVNYKLSFTGINEFSFSTSGLGTRSGTYVATKEYILCTYPGDDFPSLMVKYEEADNECGYSMQLIGAGTELQP